MTESNRTVGCIIYGEPERCAEQSIISPNVRYWGEADMPRPPAGFRSVAFDPKRTLGARGEGIDSEQFRPQGLAGLSAAG